MFKIITKAYKFCAFQLNDFPTISSNIVINLKTLKGQSSYKKLFSKFTRVTVDTIKCRPFFLDQSLLTDYSHTIGNEEPRDIDISIGYILKNPNDFKIHVVTSNGKNKKSRQTSKRHLLHIFQTMLTDFLRENISSIKNRIRLPYRKIPRTTGKYVEDNTGIPKDQIAAFNSFRGFKGYLNRLFTLNPSLNKFFDSIQNEMGYKTQYDFLNFKNIVKLEILRCKLAYSNIESFVRDYNENKTIQREINIQNNGTLSLSSYRRGLHKVSNQLLKYAQSLIIECRYLGLIDDKIWAWDRRFIKRNCNGIKSRSTGLTSDSDSGKYVKRSGSYNVLSGTGYTDTCIVDSLFGLPVYWDAVDASKNDNTVFQETVRKFQLPKPKSRNSIVLLADAGPDSYKSNIEVINRGVIPVIAARSNSVGNILKTDRGNHFRADYIPRKYHHLLQKLYDIRTTVERKNSFEVVGYNRSKTLTRGIEAARMFVTIRNITALLTALTAFKVQRIDLIRYQSAFRNLKY
ncbi:transposase [Methanosalsum natronophilum]|uniref:transposase n=1 Tax=Methanosalsum natronophilum TaxID=768733 RepID=UPI002168E221|nr:transposase [Methanosalsum natronophilum]MCS3924886.1 hypothetical protein [Methanosalsum natronophilum]